jgi:hypothetical protein
MLLVFTVVSLGAAAAFALLWWRLLREERERSRARVAALTAAIDGPPPAAAGPASARMFAPEHSAAAQGTPILRLAAGVVMGLILIVAVAANRGGSGAESPGAAAAPPALELLSMRHAREGDTLTVSGLVRNPRGGGEVARVTAVVFAFDRSGTFAGSGRAPLDFTTLDPGDESPFVVTLPNAAGVGRYRVSFRTEDGAVRHVDRRAEQARLAAAELK